MKRSRRLRPSPALLIACLALFVALGGTVLAATKIDGGTIRVKSLPGNRLEVGSVPGNRLQAATIPGSRIAPRSLNGDRLDLATLGQVPSAAHADAADTARRAQVATAAEHAADATTINGRSVGCAAGRQQFAGACWDLQPSATSTTAVGAAAACGAAGGELPDLLALFAFAQKPGVVVDVRGEWTNSENLVGANSYSLAVVERGTQFRFDQPSLENHYRCVTPLLN
ncbi:MAG: hypothetical protein JSU06_03425 [Actinobacteria bacterium]|nr:hypothetical protein [Actinomycetota bacterium]